MNEDLQAPVPSDHESRRRAFLLIAIVYALAGAANLWWLL